jgi:hypothetical protein
LSYISNMERHYCEAPRKAKEYNYGVAIYRCTELEDGTLMVDNDEYGSQVDYCPYCGYEAKVKIQKEYLAYIKREDRLQEQKTIVMTEEEVDRFTKGESVQGYLPSEIEMITSNK